MPRPIEHGYPPAGLQVHIDRNGQRFGPYTVEELNTYLAGGQVLPTDRAWYEGLADFGPLANIPGVQLPGAAAHPTPPAPPAPPAAPAAPPVPPSAPATPAAPATPPTPPASPATGAPPTPPTPDGPPTPPAPGEAPPTPGEPAKPKKQAAALLEEDLDEERLTEITKREQDLEADTCFYNGGVFFVKNPFILLLGTWLAIILALISAALIIPGGPMIAGIFNFFLQKKRLRRIGLSAMFVGFSSKFVNLMLAYLVTFFGVALSPLIGLLIIWGTLYNFDPYMVGPEVESLLETIGIALGSLADISRGQSPEEMMAYLNAAVSSSFAILAGLFSSLGALTFLNKLIAMFGGVLAVVLPLFLAANWIFTLPLCTHYNMPFTKAMKLSGQLVANDRQGFIFFLAYSIFVSFLGPLLICLGFLKLPILVPGAIMLFIGWIWMMVAAFNTEEKIGYIVSAPLGLGILIVALMILAAVLDLEFLTSIVEVLNMLTPAVGAIVGILFIVQNPKSAIAPFVISLLGGGAIALDVALYPAGPDTDPALRANLANASAILLYILGGLVSIVMPAVALTAYAVAYDQYCGRSRKMEEQPQWILTIMLIFGILGFLGLIYVAVMTLLSGYM